MSLLTPQFRVQRRVNGVVRSNHGPYYTYEHAKKQREGGKRTNADADWVILEREVTPWREVPDEP